MRTKGLKSILSIVLTFALVLTNFIGLSANTAYAGTGSETDPYSVSEAITAAKSFDGLTNVQVCAVGYIVGIYTSPNPDGIILSDSNAALNITSGDKTKNIYVIAHSTTTQNTEELAKWNTTDKIGKKVKVFGTWRKKAGAVYGSETVATIGTVSGASITITEVQDIVIPVAGISLDKTELSVPVNGTGTLTPIFDPANATNKSVIWSSSDDSIATISNGVVAGVAEGKATITAKAAGDETKTAACEITVTPQIHVTGVTLDQHEATVTAGKTITLAPAIAPDDATVKTVKWASNNTSVATVNNGVVKALREGTAAITVTTDDGSFTDSCVVTVPALPVLKIGDVRKLSDGDYVSTSAIVTRVVGGNNYFIQDDTAAIDVFSSSLKPKPVSGDMIKVYGELDIYNGLMEIIPLASSDVSIITNGNALPDPKVITIDEANTNGENYESQLIKIQNVTLGAINTSDNTKITDSNSKSINIYKIPALTNIFAGDTVDVTGLMGQYNTTNQIRVADASDIKVIDATAPVIVHTPVALGNTGENLVINAAITDNRQAAVSGKLYYRTVGEATYKNIAMTGNASEFSASIPNTELDIKGLEYYMEASDGVNTVTYPQDIASPLQVAISAEDITGPEVSDLTPASGKYTGEELRPVISAKYTDATGIDTASVKLLVDGTDVTSKATIAEGGMSYTPDADLSEGEHTVTLEVTDTAPRKNKQITTWNFFVGEVKYNLYFGQLHSHTNFSDGRGTPTEAYTWARDNAKADFFAVTDHSNSFDNDIKKDASGKIINENITNYNDSPSTEWKDLHNTANSFNNDGKFVAIAGYEMTWSGSTGGWGHINTFNTEWFASRNNSAMNLKAYYNRISQDSNSISQLNHPGNTFGDFNDFGFWSPAADKVVNLIEVGNGEGAVRSGGYFPSYEYYTEALDRGWHVAPTNNQDNHLENWVTANDARTVILAPSLTRESLYEALKQKRVYATEDKDLRIMYTANDQVMGTILSSPDTLRMSIDISDPDNEAIGKVSIIADGGIVVNEKTFPESTADWDVDLPADYSYYYVRVDQPDKDIAVTAPVWTKEVVSVGISKVDVSQNPQIVNTPTDITATVYNNEVTPLTNVKVEFYKNSISPENKIGENTIANIDAGLSGATSITWAPTEAGDIKLYARTVINYNGKDITSTGDTTFAVRTADQISKIVIDAGHYNQYVSGDYSGKILTLESLLKNKNVMLVQNKDELTASDLENAKVLIITDPQSKDSTKYNLLKSNYSDSEIQVIRDFVNAGGSLIITSRADYDDLVKDEEGHVVGCVTPEYESSKQGNRILEAIGSNLRFNDDEVIDKISNDGQTFKLHFDDYASTKYGLTDNIPAGYTYSSFSGCSVILKDGGNEEYVDWLVKGHDTTETMDSDSQNDAVPVTKGEVNSIAAELLPSGAKVIVAGTTFFSDFETAAVDNAYSNKMFTENVVDWMTGTEPVQLKKISEVRIDQNKDGIPDLLGKKFAVDGIVTAQSVGVGTNNAFFDVIYVQDETGGITVFGVSQKAIPLGTRVRVIGTVDQYQGDAELQIADEKSDVLIINKTPSLVEPKLMETGDSMLEKNEGWLVKLSGVVKKIVTENGDNSLYIDDGSGEARIFVDGYIGDGTDNKDMLGMWDPAIKVGDNVTAIGLASEDPLGHRIRVRNTAEIVKKANSNDAALSNLVISSGTLEPAFDAATTEYNVKLDYSISRITVTPTSVNDFATIRVNGILVESGKESRPISLNVGDNEITVKVKSDDGTKEKTYTIKINRGEASKEAGLSSLAPSSGTLDPEFKADVPDYKLAVDKDQYSITLTPTAVNQYATIVVNNREVKSGTASQPITLKPGDNKIRLVVTAQDGRTKKTYTIIANKGKSDNAYLSALTIDNGTLAPEFKSDVDKYTVNVKYTVDSIRVTPTTQYAKASVKVNNAEVVNGKASQKIHLKAGVDTIIEIVVKAEDKATVKKYIVTVKREAANTNTDLSSLKISSSTLNEEFAADKVSYTANVDYTVSSLKVTATTLSEYSTIKVNGRKAESGKESYSINLKSGVNTIKVEVTAQDGKTKKSYIITVTRGLANKNASLSSLTINNGTLTPDFNKDTKIYTVDVESSVVDMTVTPSTEDKTATVKVNGKAVESGKTSMPISLKAGKNTIKVEVTAQDGKTKNFYIITVNRPASSNADLSSLVESTGKLVFDAGKQDYTIDVDALVKSITITPTTADARAQIRVNGYTVKSGDTSKAITLKTGTNRIIIVVYPEKGEKKTYTITVNRAKSNNAKLSNIKISNVEINFDTDVTKYETTVASTLRSVRITPAAADPTAKIKISVNGGTASSIKTSKSIILSMGINNIEIDVTAEDGTTLTYTIIIYRGEQPV